MSGASPSLVGGPWNARRRRTKQLLSQQPHAKQLLGFYLEVLYLQEPLYHQVQTTDWPARVAAPPGGAAPSLRLEHLPLDQLLPLFRDFLDRVSPVATEVLTAAARSLDAAGRDLHTALLEQFLARTDLEAVAAVIGGDAEPLAFFPRAFLQPIAEALAEPESTAAVTTADSCPQCGWPPQVAVIRDEPEVKGRRLLVCALCAGLWPIRRSTCPSCGETDAEKLVYHVSDVLAHVRVEECKTCRAYLKAVDLRASGTAVPLVEDLASVELDLWSEEQGLRKIQPNLLGL